MTTLRSEDERAPRSESRRWPAAFVSACALVSIASICGPAMAQSWWPFGGGSSERAPVPSEPVYREPQRRSPPTQGYGQNWSSNRPPICLQLEQRLAMEANRGNQSREQLPRIEAEMRQAERTYQVGQRQLDSANCFDYFLFAKTLKRTRQCVSLNNQVENAKRQLGDLDAQRQQIMSSEGRSYRDDIVRELARYNCGPGYQQQARSFNPFSSLWQDEEGNSQGGNTFSLPFATYKTVCVRLCDGYYFPVSFSTLPNHFEHDAMVCEDKCAAPAELYFFENKPGVSIEQALSQKTQQPYSSLKSALRYRKEYVPGCSCKKAEYVPEPTSPNAIRGRRAEAPATSGGWGAATTRP
ncbi:MAG: DUF2865 domain-containing protein [Hyphomicrobiaceae bacterium]